MVGITARLRNFFYAISPRDFVLRLNFWGAWIFLVNKSRYSYSFSFCFNSNFSFSLLSFILDRYVRESNFFIKTTVYWQTKWIFLSYIKGKEWEFDPVKIYFIDSAFSGFKIGTSLALFFFYFVFLKPEQFYKLTDTF